MHSLGKLPEGIKYALELLPEVIGQPFEIYTMYMPGGNHSEICTVTNHNFREKADCSKYPI
jgi:hypothetical protein